MSVERAGREKGSERHNWVSRFWMAIEIQWKMITGPSWAAKTVIVKKKIDEKGAKLSGN